MPRKPTTGANFRTDSKRILTKLFMILCLSLLLPASSLAQNLPIDPRLMVTADQERYPNADAVLLLDDIRFEVLPDRTHSFEEHDGVKILTPEGIEEHANFVRVLDTETSTIEIFSARTVKPDGTVLEAEDPQWTPIAPESPLYSSIQRLEIQFPQVQVGDVVEFHLKTTHKPRPGGHFWATTYVENPMPIADSTFTVTIPEGVYFQTATPGMENLKPKSEVVDLDGVKYRRLFWHVTDQEMFYFEPLAPPPLSLLNRIEVSSFRDWKEVAQYIGDQWTSKSRLPEGLSLRIAGWLPASTDAVERSKALLKALGEDRSVAGVLAQDLNFHLPSEVYQEKVASPNDIALLTSVALTKAGIPNVPVASLGVSEDSLTDQLPTPEKVQKIALWLPLREDVSHWVDPDHPTFLLDGPPSGIGGVAALSWDHRFEGGPYAVSTVPQPSALVHREELALEGRVESSGRAELTVQFDRYGTAALSARQAARDVTEGGREFRERALEGFFNSLARTYSQRARILSRFFELEADSDDPFGLSFTLAVPNYGESQDGTLLVPLPRYLSSSLRVAARDLKRTTPLLLEQPYQQDVRVHLILPEGSRITKFPESVSLRTPEIEFESATRTAENQLWYVGRLTVHKAYVEGDHIARVLSLVQQAINNESTIVQAELPSERETSTDLESNDDEDDSEETEDTEEDLDDE